MNKTFTFSLFTVELTYNILLCIIITGSRCCCTVTFGISCKHELLLRITYAKGECVITLVVIKCNTGVWMHITTIELRCKYCNCYWIYRDSRCHIIATSTVNRPIFSTIDCWLQGNEITDYKNFPEPHQWQKSFQVRVMITFPN